MCSNLIIDGHTFDCYGKLSKYMKKKGGVPLPFEDKLPYQSCLCFVDIQALVNRLQKRAVADASDIYFGDDAEKVPEEDVCGTWEVEK